MRCPQCGKEVGSDWRFCRSCGEELADQTAATDAAPPTVEPVVPAPPGESHLPAVRDVPHWSEVPAAPDLTVITEPPLVLDVPASDAVRTSSDVTAPLQHLTTFVQSSIPPKRPRPVLMIAGWAIAILALSASIVIFVSRSSVSSKLSSTRTELSSTKADLASSRADLGATKEQLSEAQATAKGLDDQVDSLSAANEKADSDLKAAQEKNASLQKKVDGCQDMFRISVDVAKAGGSVTDAQGAKLTTDVLKCYGKFPDFLAGG